jgi:ribosomal protein S13
MRFEHILQVYWSKGFFFGGKLFYNHKLFWNDMTKYNLYGLGSKFKSLLIKRFELTTFALFYANTIFLVQYFNKFHKKIVKTLNILFSQINNVNSTVQTLKRYNIIRQYLVKSYKGYCHSIGKPVRGQRTWSNSWNSFKCNNILRNFITQIKHIKSLNTKNTPDKIDYRSIKKKYLTQSTTRTHALVKHTNQLLPSKSWY